MTITAIDYGKRRLGIAAGDPTGLVYPAGIIERHSLKRDLAAVSTRLRELEASRVIVGLPLNMDGTAGPVAHAARRFADQLRDATGLKVELYDERLSTFEAVERMKTVRQRGRRRREVDAVAALIILESWLAAHQNER